MTVLESVSAGARTLTYNYTVTLSGQEINLETLTTNILANTCTDEDLLTLVNDDVVIDHVYRSEYGTHVGTITVTKEDCL